jgi:acyl-CoA dehydrogenase
MTTSRCGRTSRGSSPEDVRSAIEPELREMGRISAELYPVQLADRANEPRLTQWDPWGRRVDHIELTPLWRTAARIAAERGVVATAYERSHGPYSRIHQFALAYLFTPSTDIYSCPLAMTDGAASVLLRSGNAKLIDRAIPRLTSRDPDTMWTSGQWMTETIGGSDVGRSETVARKAPDGTWRLYGRKWFTSAATAEMALTLARPEGGDPGGRGLALFYLETRDAAGDLNGISIDRLKDKLGTRKLPTAELTLDGVRAFRWGIFETASGRSRRCSTSPAPGTRLARPPSCGVASPSPAITRTVARPSAGHSPSTPYTSTPSMACTPSSRAHSTSPSE